MEFIAIVLGIPLATIGCFSVVVAVMKQFNRIRRPQPKIIRGQFKGKHKHRKAA